MKNSLTVKTASVFLTALILSTFAPIVNAQGAVPSVFTNSSSNLLTTSATLRGSVNPNNSSTTAWFEYGPTQSLGSTTTTFAIGGGTSQTSFSGTAFGLSPNTTHYYRAVAQNSHGTARGSILSFTTQANPIKQNQGGAPIARTESMSGVSTTSATLLGSINPNGASTEGWFEYGTTQSLASSTSRQNIGSGSGFNNFNFTLASLSQNTTYYYRAMAQNNFGTSQGTILSFTTKSQQVLGGAPLVSTTSSSNVSIVNATLHGSVNPNNSNTTAWFEYGPTQSLGSTTTTFAIGGGTSQTSFSGTAFGLSPNTTHYYRAVAQNSHGTARGSILSFTTQANPIKQNQGGAPIARTESMSGVSTTSATLLGSINPNGASTEGWFEYGTTQSLASSTSRQNIGSGSGFNNFNFTLASLSQNTTYYYRAMAQNNFGTSQGTILSFTTKSQQVSGGTPLVNTNSASAISTSSATLYGSANPNNSFATGWFEYGASGSLGSATSRFTLGSSNSYQSYYATIFNLFPNTTYYYRAVAQNGYGTAYGPLLTLTTGTNQVMTNQDLSGLSNSLSQLTVALARLNGLVGGLGANRVTERVIERVEVASSAGSDLAKLTFIADKESLDPGDKIVFTVKIEPFINLTKAILAVKLDPGFEFESTSVSSYSKSENTLAYNLSGVATGSVQTFAINARLKSDFKANDAKDGKITSAATFSYADANGNVKTPLFSSLDVKIGGMGLLAGIFAALPGGAAVTILLIAFLILLIAIMIRKLLN